MHNRPWSHILDEARTAFLGDGRFPLRAYSEFMPPPWVALKPYEPDVLLTPPASDDALDITEYEELQELRPGLEKLAGHLLGELARLAAGGSHELSRTLLSGNPAWPQALADRARASPGAPLLLLMPLALSRTQDDKGRVRWTLFGSSHDGPSRALWRSFPANDATAFLRLMAWATGAPLASVDEARRAGLRVLPRGADPDFPAWSDEPFPAFSGPLLLGPGEALEGVRWLLTFRPFERLPAEIQRAYLAGALRLLPDPASLVFFEHPHYRRLSRTLPHAMQLPLLHVFPRSENRYGLRIPQSGWLDEHPVGHPGPTGGHRMVRSIKRRHRWQRTERHLESVEPDAFEDHVTVALFSTRPEDLGLYRKPMARNAQIWTEEYELLLDGPRASPAELAAAAKRVHQGGRFGYRFLYPPMRAGLRSLYWHRVLAARLDPATGQLDVLTVPPLGHVSAEAPGQMPLELSPRLLDREGHRAAARLVEREPNRPRFATAANARKLLEWCELLARPLPYSFAQRLLHAGHDTRLEDWIATLPVHAPEPDKAGPLLEALQARLGPWHPMEYGPEGTPRSLTFAKTATRDFEERLWGTIASLSEGTFLQTDNADEVSVNAGRTGGPRAAAAGLRPGEGRDLDQLGEHLHARYEELIARHGMAGRALVADHRLRWETDFALPWSKGWARSAGGEHAERNIVMVIPGNNRGEAVVMADHYDTAYMEDVYEPSRGGDHLRAAAAGADDNHSATAALLLAADVLLPLAREGRLERDVWLIHLTGEEFPADCLGARALAQALVQRSLKLSAPDGREVDVSGTKVRGVFVLDMVAHNNSRARDIFQIAPGEGSGSAALALRAHLANERWNRSAPMWNLAGGRKGLDRARRMETGAVPPPPFPHLPLAGEIRPEWDPRSALFNTDGQIFSDVGVPVVLFMENYDIRREGYHDTQDTMKNIDLDYGAALVAIAIETVADLACARDP